MQKTFKYLVCAIALAVGFTNCTKETMDLGNKGNGNVDKEGTSTYATFNFVINGASTKASDMINDSKETDKINDIRLIIFKSGATTTCEVNEAYDTNSAAPNPWDTSKSKTVQLTSGKKRIFVIANAENQQGVKAALDAIVVGTTTINQFYDMVYDLGKTLGKMGELVSETSGFIMSNSISSKSSFELKGGIGLDESRTGNEQQNNFKIEIQRAVAKAAVWYENASVLETTDKVGKLTDLKYAIRNVNRAVYLFQKFVSDMVDPANSVPNSPYYSLPTGTAVAVYDTIYYKDYKFIPVASASPTQKVYATENTSEVQRNATTTYASIEGVFLPKKGMIVQSCKYNELTNSFNTVVTNATDATAGTTLYRLVNVGTSTGITANIFFTDKQLAYKVAYCIDKKTETGFDINNISNLVWDETTGKGHIVEYENGKCYYRLNLGEGNGNNFNPGLKRNYGYNAKITSFAGLGMPKLEDLDKDPDKPIGQKTHVTATISVAPWVNVNTDHQL
jgi:hypothetical protein